MPAHRVVDLDGQPADGVRGRRDVPVRRDGRFWVCAVQIDYGYYWSAREVQDARPID